MRLLRRAGAEARPERSVVGQGTTGQAAGVRETEKVASEEPERGSLGGAGRAQNLRGDPLDCGVLYPECIKPCEPCRSCFEFYFTLLHSISIYFTLQSSDTHTYMDVCSHTHTLVYD